MKLPQTFTNYQHLQQKISKKIYENKQDTEFVDLLNNYAEKLRLGNQDFAKSLEYSKKARNIAKIISYDEGLAWALLNIGSCLIYTDFSPEPNRVLEESLAIFQRLNNSHGEAHALIITGAVLMSDEDYVSAYDKMERGLNLSFLTNYKKGEAIAYYFLAILSEKLEDTISTINYCKLALSLSDDFDIKARLYAIIGTNLLQDGKIEEAKENLKIALEESEKVNDAFSISNIFIQLGKISILENRIDRAKEHFNKSLEITKNIGLSDISSNVLEEIANAFIEIEDYECALKILKKFQETNHVSSNPNRMAIVLMKIASINIKLKKSALSVVLLEQIWDIVSKGSNMKLKYECQKGFSEVFEMKKDYEEALKHHKMFQKYKEEFDRNGTANKIKILANRTKVEKERDIIQVTKEKNTEVAKMVFEVYEKIDALSKAEETILSLQVENSRLVRNTNSVH